MMKHALLAIFATLGSAVLYRLLVPPPLPFEIYPAPYSVFTFGVLHGDDGRIEETRNTYIVKGYSTVSEEELKRKLDSFTCTIWPNETEDKGGFKVNFYRFSKRTQDKYLEGPLAEDITFWASEDYLMFYGLSANKKYTWLHANEELMPQTYSERGIVTGNFCQ